jgi:hypothetical protein
MFWNRNLSAGTNTAEAGDRMQRKPLLVVANEIRGTTTVWQID